MDSGAVLLRPAERRDAAAVAAVYAPYVESSVASFEEVAPDADELARRMLAAPRLPWYVADDAGCVVGYAYASHHRSRAAYRWAVECSVYLDPAWQGQGLGGRLYWQVVDDLRGLGYVTALAGITLPNEASVRLHESVGFLPLGTFGAVGFKRGRWLDVGWWQLALTPQPAVPSEPRAWVPADTG